MRQPVAEIARLDSAVQLGEIEEAIALCGGDARAALRAALIANAYLQGEVGRLADAVSTGFARVRVRDAPAAPRRGRKRPDEQCTIFTVSPRGMPQLSR